MPLPRLYIYTDLNKAGTLKDWTEKKMFTKRHFFVRLVCEVSLVFFFL